MPAQSAYLKFLTSLPNALAEKISSANWALDSVDKGLAELVSAGVLTKYDAARLHNKFLGSLDPEVRGPLLELERLADEHYGPKLRSSSTRTTDKRR